MPDAKRRIKFTLAAVVLLGVSAVAWSFFQFHSARGKLEQAVPEIAAKAVMALSNVSQTATRDGVVQWKLDAASAELEADTGKMILQSPEVLFFMEDGTEIHMTALQGTLHTRSNDMDIEGNVSLRNSRYTLKTDTLSYNHERRILQAGTTVHISGEALQLTAATMTYDLNTNQAVFEGRVKGTLQDKYAL